MKTFEFKTHGGTTIDVTNESITISAKGVKGWLFQRIKPRSKTIPLNDIIRIDYKHGGTTVGYIRLITDEIAEYQSSLYVAEHDPNGFIFDKDEMVTFIALMENITKKLPNVPTKQLKM